MKVTFLTLAVVISAISMAHAAGGGPYLPPHSSATSASTESKTIEASSTGEQVSAGTAPAAHYTAPPAQAVPPVPVPVIAYPDPSAAYGQAAASAPPQSIVGYGQPAGFPYGAQQFSAPAYAYQGQGGFVQAGSAPAVQYASPGPVAAYGQGAFAAGQQPAGGYVQAASAPAYQYAQPAAYGGGFSAAGQQQGGFIQAGSAPGPQYVIPAGIPYGQGNAAFGQGGYFQAGSAPNYGYTSPAQAPAGQVFLSGGGQAGGYFAGRTQYALNGGYANKVKK